ncbi:hypothetical protein [Streptomyces sp. CA-111067]|uniref:hypothetical protein n=1 Tax=Streptomyces sp. CA-111067 TaxID=3240046 RepID=UPI003D995255
MSGSEGPARDLTRARPTAATTSAISPVTAQLTSRAPCAAATWAASSQPAPGPSSA